MFLIIIQVQDKNICLSDQHKVDEAKAGGIEQSLKDKLDALKKKLKEEGILKVKYGVSYYSYM